LDDPAKVKKAWRKQKGVKHMFKKWLADSVIFTKEQMEMPAVERRRLFETKNQNRSTAAIKRQREGDGKFLSHPKRIFKVGKGREVRPSVDLFLRSSSSSYSDSLCSFESERIY
jgi:hypothetical protein